MCALHGHAHRERGRAVTPGPGCWALHVGPPPHPALIVAPPCTQAPRRVCHHMFHAEHNRARHGIDPWPGSRCLPWEGAVDWGRAPGDSSRCRCALSGVPAVPVSVPKNFSHILFGRPCKIWLLLLKLVFIAGSRHLPGCWRHSPLLDTAGLAPCPPWADCWTHMRTATMIRPRPTHQV